MAVKRFQTRTEEEIEQLVHDKSSKSLFPLGPVIKCLLLHLILKLISEMPPAHIVSITYILLDGLSYNTRGYFASCVVFFRAPQGRGKMRAMSKMSASIIC